MTSTGDTDIEAPPVEQLEVETSKPMSEIAITFLATVCGECNVSPSLSLLVHTIAALMGS